MPLAFTPPLRRNAASRKPRSDCRSRGSPLQTRVSHFNHPPGDPLRVNECRVSVRDVRGSAPRHRSDASLTHCPVEDSEMCPEMRLAGRDVPRKNIHNSNLAVARTSEMSEIRPTCPKLAPHAEIRVACPRFALQRHRVMTNLPTFFLSLSSLEIPSFFGTLIDIYIFYIYYFFNTTPIFRPA